MLNEREMQYRQGLRRESGVPYTNYGILIAYMNGILKRSLAPFEGMRICSDEAKPAGQKRSIEKAAVPKPGAAAFAMP